jgi:CubicO group peptidase (beta-lactamase class C family)
MGRIVRVLLIDAGSLVLATLLLFAALSVMYSPGYVLRWALWQEADVGDAARFPARSIDAASEPFQFAMAADPAADAARVRSALEASPAVGGDAEAFLEATGTQALIVIKNDTVLYEGYFNGFERETIATSFSTAKSYVSALVGIAIQEGVIRDVDDPITDYLPELRERDPRFGAITIRHLLDMTSGLRYEETGLPWGDDALTYYFDDLHRLALERSEIVEAPGLHWHYNNYNPLLLGLILERTTGMSVADYLESRIWRRTGTEFDASWSLDKDDGYEKMESGLNARPIDFAKLGRLYLDGGTWDGEQIVPADWVKASVAIPPPGSTEYPSSFEREYGSVSHQLYWWRISLPDGDHAYSALGNQGQFIFIAPEQRLIVVRNGERYGIPSLDWFGTFVELADRL